MANCDPQPDELIVVEQSAEVDLQVEEALKLFGDRGILVRQGKPNAQVARNEAARQSRSEILLFLDDDVDPDRNLIAAHLENYKDTSIHAVAGFYLEPGERESSQPRPTAWWRPLTHIEKIPAYFSERIDSPLWPSCNGSIRKEVFMKIGGFDEMFQYTLFDDTDLSVRLLRAGYRCVHDPSARLLHLKEPTGGNRPVQLQDQVIAPAPRWSTWTYFFLINWGIRGVGELVYRCRTHVFRRPYLMRPWLFLTAMNAFIRGTLQGGKLFMSGRRLGRFV